LKIKPEVFRQGLYFAKIKNRGGYLITTHVLQDEKFPKGTELLFKNPMTDNYGLMP